MYWFTADFWGWKVYCRRKPAIWPKFRRSPTAAAIIDAAKAAAGRRDGKSGDRRPVISGLAAVYHAPDNFNVICLGA